MEKMLTSKNVATEIAEEICNRVRIKLVGKKMASFTRVKTAVRQALEDAIEKILKPGKGRGGSDDVDVLRDVIAKREKGNGFLRGKTEKPKPFVIVMGKFIHSTYFEVLNNDCI
jgi:signal recognition particle receptor subunit alpha